MHPRVCLHQVGFLSESTPAFVAFCREIGVRHMTLANPHMIGPTELDDTLAALAEGGVSATNVTQPFARYPDIERDEGGAAEHLNAAIEAAAAMASENLYIVTGARGSLDWEAAAQRCAELIAPCRDLAQARRINLLVETANMLNADIHMAHTIDDTVRLAEIAGIGVCIDLGASWFEGGLQDKFRRAMPLTRLVQVSDYVLGDKFTPHRAVPGDGVVPLAQQIGWLLEVGYDGVFDIELTGPRIVEEGHRKAFLRAAENLSEILVKLGA